MPQLMTPPPYSAVEPVTEIFHGVSVTDPYRWLEDQDSPRTRDWIKEQTLYARAYLDSIPGRKRIRERIQEFLVVATSFENACPTKSSLAFTCVKAQTARISFSSTHLKEGPATSLQSSLCEFHLTVDCCCMR